LIDASSFSTTTLPQRRSAQVFNLDVAYAVLARTLAARRDNLKATVATLEKRLAERADKVPRLVVVRVG
jgi:hypothetical protein